MKIQKRFVDFNLNRLFSGDYKNYDDSILEKSRAKEIETAINDFFKGSIHENYHLDLHTAIRGSLIEKFAVLPLNNEKEHNKSFYNLLAHCGIEAALLTTEPNTVLSSHSSYNHQAYAATLELGSVTPFGQNDLSKLQNLSDTLNQLIEGTYQEDSLTEHQIQLYRISQNILKQDESLELMFDDDLKNFTSFKKGTIIAKDNGEEYISTSDDECVVFPNKNVEIGQRVMYTAIPVKD